MCAKPKTIMGTVIVAIIVASLTGTLGWIALQSASVPALQIEFKHLSTSINSLVKTIKVQNQEIRNFQSANLVEHRAIIETMQSNVYEIKTLNRDCEEMRAYKKRIEK